MCHRCRCRQIPLIRDYIEEHEQIIDIGDDSLRVLDRGDVDRAHQSLSRMHEILTSHWEGEEAGVFAAMSETDAPTPSTSRSSSASTARWRQSWKCSTSRSPLIASA